jgi:anti-sigma B factor antagonist
VRPFQIKENELGDDGRELHVEGELDLAVADQLQSALDRAEGCKGIVIGLEECDFIDSTGIAVIVRGHHRMEAAGGGLAAHSANGGVLRILEMTGLTKNGLIFETPEQARAAVFGTPVA